MIEIENVANESCSPNLTFRQKIIFRKIELIFGPEN